MPRHPNVPSPKSKEKAKKNTLDSSLVCPFFLLLITQYKVYQSYKESLKS